MCAKTSDIEKQKKVNDKATKQRSKTLSTSDFASKYAKYTSASTNMKTSASGTKTTSTSSNGGIMSVTDFANKYSQYRPNKSTSLPTSMQTTSTSKPVTNSPTLKASTDNAKANNFLERFEQNYKTSADIDNRNSRRVGQAMTSGVQEAVGGLSGFVAKTLKNGNGTSAEELIDYGDAKQDNYYKQNTENEQKAFKQAMNTMYNLTNKAESNIKLAKQDATKVGQFMLDLTKVGTQIGLDAIASAVTGGYGGMASMYARATGLGYKEALDNGATESEAQTYGSMVGAVEMLTERLSGGLGKVYGKGIGEGIGAKVITNTMKKLGASADGVKAVVKLSQIIGEGNEELISDIVNPILRSATYGGNLKEEYAQEKLSDWAYDWLLGAASGGLGAVTNANTNLNAEVDTYMANNKNVADALLQLDKQAEVSNSVVKNIMQDKNALQQLGIDANGKKASEIKTEIREAIDEIYYNRDTTSQNDVERNLEQSNINIQDNVENQSSNVTEPLNNNVVQDNTTEVQNANAEVNNVVDNANIATENVANNAEDVANDVTDNTTNETLRNEYVKTFGEEATKILEQNDFLYSDKMNTKDAMEILRSGYEGKSFEYKQSIGISIAQQKNLYLAGIQARENRYSKLVKESEKILADKVKSGEISSREARVYKNIEKILKHRIIFEKELSDGVLGYMDRLGDVHIRAELPINETYAQIIGHELWHSYVKTDNRLTDSVTKTIKSMLSDEELARIIDSKKGNGYAEVEINEEVIADAFGVIFSQKKFMQQYAYVDLNSFEKVIAKFKDFVNDLKNNAKTLSKVYEKDFNSLINKVDDVIDIANDVIKSHSVREVGVVDDGNSATQKFKKVSGEKSSPIDFKNVNASSLNTNNLMQVLRNNGLEKEVNQFTKLFKAPNDNLRDVVYKELEKQIGEDRIVTVLEEYKNLPKENASKVKTQATEIVLKKQLEELNKAHEEYQQLKQELDKKDSANKELLKQINVLEEMIGDNSKEINKVAYLQKALNSKKLENSIKELDRRVIALNKTKSDNILFNQHKETVLNLVAEIMSNVNAQVENITNFEFNADNLNVNNIENVITQLQDSGYVFSDKAITDLFNSINKMKFNYVAELTPSQIYKLAEIVSSVAKQVDAHGKQIIGGKLYDNDLIVNEIVNDFTDMYVPKHKPYKSMRPENLYSMLSGYKDNYFAKVLRSIQKGSWDAMKFKNDMVKRLGKYTTNEWKKHLLEGVTYKNVKLNRDLLISIYMHTLNSDNINHITNGGMKIPLIEQYYKQNEKDKAWDKSKILVIDDDIESVQKEITSLLTEEDMRYISALQESIIAMQKDVNYTSRLIQSANAWNIENYWAINVDKSLVGEANDRLGSTISSVATFGNRNHTSQKTILLHGTQDHINNLINIYSNYCGLAIPLHNVYGLLGVNANGTDIGETSISNELRKKFDDDAIKALTMSLRDVEGLPRSNESTWYKWWTTLRSLSYGRALVLNVGVSAKQTVSALASISEIDAKNLGKRLVNHNKLGVNRLDDLINKYTALLDVRTEGMGDFENTTTGIREVPFEKINLNAKLNQYKFVNGITLMDYATVKGLWYACENNIISNTNLRPNANLAMKGKDPFYVEVASLFNDVVTRTQPNYSVMERAEFIKSKDTLAQLISMYKTQPAQNYNQLQYHINKYNAYKEYKKQGKVTEAELNKVKNATVKAVSALIIQSLAYTLLDEAIVSFRSGKLPFGEKDDEDDEKALVKFAKWLFGIAESLVGGTYYGWLTTIGKSVLGVKDYTDRVGTDLFEQINNLSDTLNTFSSSAFDSEKTEEQKTKAIQKVTRSIFDLSGYFVPSQELKRIYKIVENYNDKFSESKFNESFAPWVIHS